MRSRIKKALELALWFLAGFVISTLIILPAAEDSVPAQTENDMNA